jgi:hypothetical protein
MVMSGAISRVGSYQSCWKRSVVFGAISRVGSYQSCWKLSVVFGARLRLSICVLMLAAETSIGIFNAVYSGVVARFSANAHRARRAGAAAQQSNVTVARGGLTRVGWAAIMRGHNRIDATMTSRFGVTGLRIDRINHLMEGHVVVCHGSTP